MPGALRKMGNSTGIIVPKAVLREAGVKQGTVLDFKVEDGRIILQRVDEHPRAGWAEDAARIAAEPEDPDEADWRAFGNDADAEWTW